MNNLKNTVIILLGLLLLNSSGDAQTIEKLAKAIDQSMPHSKSKIKSLNKAIRLRPGMPKLYFLRGIIEFANDKIKKANKDFDKATALTPNKSDTVVAYYFIAGINNEKDWDFKKATHYYMLASKLDSNDDLIYFKIGYCKGHLGNDSGSSILYYDKAIRLNSQDPQYFLYRGVEKYWTKDTLGAILDFSTAIELKKTNYISEDTDRWREGWYSWKVQDIYEWRGLSFEELKEYAKAMADFDKVLTIDSTDFWTYEDIASIWNKMGDYRKGMAEANKAIKLSEGINVGYYERGNAKYGLGDTNGALIDYNYAIKHGSLIDYCISLVARGKIKVKNKKYASAIKDFTKAIRQGDANGEAYFERGKTEIILKQNSEGCGDLNKAISFGWYPAKKELQENCK